MERFPQEGLNLARQCHEAGYRLTIKRHVFSAGRNEPCPCGSGTKFKRCHDGSTYWIRGKK